MHHTHINSIYRQPAINNLNNHEEAVSLNVIGLSHWLIIIACLLIIAAIGIWGLFGSITLSIETAGIILPTSEVYAAELIIEQFNQEQKKAVEELLQIYNKKIELYNKHFLTIIDLLKAKEDYLSARNKLQNDNMLVTHPIQHEDNSENLIALAFIPSAIGTKITPGATVESNYHSITGQIIEISSAPISKQLATFYLRNSSLVDEYFIGGAPFLAKIRLNASTSPSIHREINSSKIIKAKIFYDTCQPFKLLTKGNACA